MDLQYGDHRYSTCMMQARSFTKRQGAFLPNFQESLFLAWIHTIGT